LATVLGFYYYWTTSNHEGSAIIVKDGKILAAIEEDRITRVKHDGNIPVWNSIKEVMRISGVRPEEIDAVAIPWESPRVKYIKGLTEVLQGKPFKPKRLIMYPYWRLNDMNIRSTLNYFDIHAPIYYVNHHESHAASTLLTSGLEDSTVITLDRSGDRYESVGVWKAQDNEMKKLTIINGCTFGTFFAAATYAVGFKINDGEGKTMGLASYGDYSKTYNKIKDLLKVKGLKIKSKINDGIIKPRIDINDDRLFALYRHLKAEKNNPIIKLTRRYKNEDIAAAAQKLLEDRVKELVKNSIKKTGEARICLSGGVALNMKMNQRVREMPEVEEVYIFPNPGDPGVVVGATMLVCKNLMEQEGREFHNERMKHTYYGTGYKDKDVTKALEEYRLDYQKIKNPEKTAAELINNDKVVGWFQGRLEFGPRALGNRSVLADPRNEKIKDKINKYLKKRDWFMPFAPSILSEAKEEYFENAVEAPFMIMGFDVKKDKLKEIPAVVHVDNTARPQTVDKKVNPSYWKVIKEFEKLSGVPVILNTSFNRHGQPMVRSPQDAALHVVWGCVEYLIMHNCLVDAKVDLSKMRL